MFRKAILFGVMVLLFDLVLRQNTNLYSNERLKDYLLKIREFPSNALHHDFSQFNFQNIKLDHIESKIKGKV